jgi:hypothetical protein
MLGSQGRDLRLVHRGYSPGGESVFGRQTMKTILRWFLLAALVFGVVALPHSAALAGGGQEVLFSFDLLDFGGVAEGEFVGEGAVNDSGPAMQTYEFLSETLVVGTKYLYGEKGTIVIRFKAVIQPDGSAVGQFQVIKGTDAYRWLKGYGKTYAMMSLQDDGLHLIGYYKGLVYYIDPK